MTIEELAQELATLRERVEHLEGMAENMLGSCDDCGKPGEYRENPAWNALPGAMIWICDECYDDICQSN
jgi:ribosomal protein L37AE/L43A